MERAALNLVVVVSCSIPSGCAHTSDRPALEAAERESPTDTVLALRARLAASDWTGAARCVAPGSGYQRARPASLDQEAAWRVAWPVPGAKARLFPLGPDDAVGAATALPNGDVQVEICHADRLGKDPRPRALILRQRGGEWLITSWRNW